MTGTSSSNRVLRGTNGEMLRNIMIYSMLSRMLHSVTSCWRSGALKVTGTSSSNRVLGYKWGKDEQI